MLGSRGFDAAQHLTSEDGTNRLEARRAENLRSLGLGLVLRCRAVDAGRRGPVAGRRLIGRRFRSTRPSKVEAAEFIAEDCRFDHLLPFARRAPRPRRMKDEQDQPPVEGVERQMKARRQVANASAEFEDLLAQIRFADNRALAPVLPLERERAA